MSRAGLTTLWLLTLTGVARAEPWQDLAAIGAVAEAAASAQLASANGRVGVAADPVDPRLRLPACDAPLTGALPATTRETNRVTTEVRCAGSRPWRVFVPVRVTVHKTLIVAAVPLERGKVLAAGDVILAEREVGAVAGGYLTAVDAAVGRVVRRNVAAGAVVAPAALESPVLVKRGQPVTLEAKSGAITVQMAGVAQGDGALGQTVSVRNTNSKKILQAIVRNEKTVEVLVP